MSEAAKYIANAGEFYIWIVRVLDKLDNPNQRDSDYLFDIHPSTWQTYRGWAKDAAEGVKPSKPIALPDGKMIKKIIMSRAFELMPPDERRILVRVWAHVAMSSAQKGTAPSAEFIEFIGFILRKCPEHLLERSVRAVKSLKN